MSFVLDASLTVAWFLNEPGPALGDIVDRLAEDGAVVPRLWPLEVANAFQIAIRKDRTTAADRDAAFGELRRMAITIDTGADDLAWTTIVELSDRFSLTAYDASYVELAHRRRLPLATLDKAMIAAAKRMDIKILS